MIQLGTIGKPLTVPMVKRCPHTKASKGIIRMSPELISMLAAAVADKDEWAIILKGTRSADGYEADVTSFWMPQQDRSGGHVDIQEYDGFEITDGVVKQNDDIAVIHSHNSMGAFFSQLDKDKLNPRFPISIVVAQKKLTYLGFSYEGVGKVSLPCGAKAEVPFFIQPTTGPVINVVERFVHPEDNEVKDLEDCSNYDDITEDEFHVHYQAKCGLHEPKLLRADAFGKENKDLLKMVEALPRAPVVVFNQNAVGLTAWKGNQNSADYAEQKRIREDDDSTWCKKHIVWDYCEFNAKFKEAKNNKLDMIWCVVHQKADYCVSTLRADAKKATPKTSAKNPKGKGSKRNRGWLGKYEDCLAGNTNICHGPGCIKYIKPDSLYCSHPCYTNSLALDSALEEAEETINRYWCEVCKDWDEFEDGDCSFCGALWCNECQQGHSAIAQCFRKGNKQEDGCIIVY